MSKERCTAMVTDHTGFHEYHCLKPASVTEDGKPWCAYHAPSKVEARRVAKSAEYDAKWARIEQRDNLAALCERVCDAAMVWWRWNDDESHSALRSTTEHLEAACAALDAAKKEQP